MAKADIQPNIPDYPWEPDYERPMNPVHRVGRVLANFIRYPAHWVREYIVEPNRGPRYYWYHKKFEKALPIDECYLDDQACIYEANIEFQRGFIVDRATLELLRYRRDNCWYWNQTTRDEEYPHENCDHLADTLKEAELNFHIKYGDTRHNVSVLEAYNKQKHRMIMERRIALRKQAQDSQANE